MNEVVHEAAQVVLPFLGAGAGAAAHGFAEQTGARLSDGTRRVLEQLRQRLAGRHEDGPEVAKVMQEALGEGAMTERDLQVLVAEIGRVQVSQQAKNIFNAPIRAQVFNA